MTLTYKNSWDEIQNNLMQYASRDKQFRIAEAAYKIKSIIESIEQQKKIAELQGSLIGQQKEVSIQTRKLGRATWALVLFTGLLFFSTLLYTIFTYQGSKKQIEAMNRLSKASESQVIAVNNLEKSIQGVPPAIKKLGESVQKIPAIADMIETQKKLKTIRSRSSRQQRGLGAKTN